MTTATHTDIRVFICYAREDMATAKRLYQDLQRAGVLTVLQPFLITQKEQVFHEIQEWKTELRSLPFPEETCQVLLGLLEYLIIQRFPKINRKEVETMLHLTPIEETVIGKELIALGEKKGRQDGLSKGELIGEIRALQKVLQRPVTPIPALIRKGANALNAMLAELEAELRPAAPEAGRRLYPRS